MRRGAVAMLLASLAAPVAADDYRDATIRVISAPDCVDGANFVAESDPAPRNATFMRVQHIGDPGTDELAGQVRNVVTWDVGQASGLSLAPSTFVQTQRGYRDFGLPEPASAFQLACNGAGFVINSRRFSHSVAVVLEGPSASIARELEPAAPVFGNATSALTIEATIRVPYMRVDAPPFVDGTAQVSFVYYVRDVTTGTVFPHVIQLFDNRLAGVNGAGTEAVSADVNSPFVVSPLSFATADGEPTQYVSAAPDSALLQYVSPWTEARTFRVQVSYARFKALLARLIRDALPGISPRPEDYRVALFGVLGEIFPGTGTSHEVALGASVVDMRLVEAFYDIAPVTVVEFYNASLDHYFISARADDIAALDSGRLPGWTRTGASFGAYPAFVAGTQPVCRFYLPPAWGDSHFFSASREECRAVATRFAQFVLEDPEVMYAALPDVQTGTCPTDTMPAYRLWNARSATNHRYVTDLAIRDVMVASGWIPEGYGDLGVALCAPRATAAAG